MTIALSMSAFFLLEVNVSFFHTFFFLIFSFKIITEQLLVVTKILLTSYQTEAKLLDGSKLKTLFAIQYCSHQHLNF